MNFTQQFRAGIGATARESLDEELALPAEQVEAVLAEPVAAEIEQEVVAPASDIADGADALIEADGEADTLEATAAILEETTADNGAGVEAPGAAMAAMTLERIANKYSLARTSTFSLESMGTASGRKRTTLSLAKEAEDNAKTLRERVVAGFQAVIKWLTDLIKNIFDKRTKLANRCGAIQTQIGALKGKQASDAKIKVGGNAAMLGGKVSDSPLAVLEALPELIAKLADVRALTEGGVGTEKVTVESEDYNPKQLGGFTLGVSMKDGKLVVSKENTGESASKEIKALDVNDCKAIVATSRKSLDALAKGEADLKTAVAEMNKGVGKLRTLVTGTDGGGKADRGMIMARYSGISKLSGTIAGTSLSVIAGALGAAEKSLATFKEEAKK